MVVNWLCMWCWLGDLLLLVVDMVDFVDFC